MANAPMFLRELGLPARTAIYSLIALVLIVVDARYDTMAMARAAVAWALQPVQDILAEPFAFLGEASAFFIVHGELLQDNRRLLAERQRLLVRLQAYTTLETENARLRALLALPTPAGSAPRAVEIVRALPDPFARKLVIGLGARAGVEAGRPVIDADGLVGQVTRVYPGSSEITLLTSREQSAPVESQRNGLRLIVSGVGSDALLEVPYLDMHADLKPGDLLVTSGIDGVFPRGIPVARVLRIEPPRQSPFARAICTPLGGTGSHRHLYLLSREAERP